MSTPVTYDREAGIVVLTLNRPDALNAFTDEMESALIEGFDRADADRRVRAVVLTGTGRAFCAGMDLSESAPQETFQDWRSRPTAPPGTQYDQPGEPWPFRRDGGGRVALRMFESTRPVVAAINGHAVGVGITMTLAADARLMADHAKVAFPFTRRAFVPESCSSWFLPRLVGPATALDWLLSGRTFEAREALDRGLVDALRPAEELVEAGLERARSLTAGTSAVSVAFTRRMVWHALTLSHPMEAHQIESVALNRRGVSVDAQAGVTAFLEGREPAFATELSDDEVQLLRSWTSPSYQPPEGATRR